MFVVTDEAVAALEASVRSIAASDPISAMEHQSDHERRVREALSAITLPGADEDPLSSGAVAEIDVHGPEATVVLDPAAASGDLRTAAAAAAESVDGIEAVDVVDADADEGMANNVEDFDRVVAVASAKGGVGKSTVTTHLASALATEGDVAVFDADIHGPNVPRLFEVDGPVRSDDDGRPRPISHEGIEVMSVGLLEDGAPLAWRGAMAHDALSQLFGETAWDSTDTLVVDLPPGTGDVVLTTLEEVPVDGLVVVTTPFHTSIADTNRTVDLFRDEGVPVLGAVVNMSSITCECCGEPNDLFEDGVADLRTETLARLPFDQEFQGRPSPGDVPSAFVDLADRVDDELSAMGGYVAPEEAVDIRGLPPGTRRQRVREAFEATDAGEAFVVVSDRDPEPVRSFLADVASVDPAALDPFDVERRTPLSWELRTVRP
jgi:ATP-binding protein involved in chromosome partitioning